MKFSIVTPSYNSGKYLSETIESVISQKGDFDIEYTIVDGGSTDNSLDVIKKYEHLINHGNYDFKCKNVCLRWLSEKDKGMYDAINKGFSMATGDIYAWINADDLYLPGAFDIVNKVFQRYHEIQWLKGITSYINESSTIYQAGNCFLYDQKWIEKGVYGREAYFIQQDSVFWRSDLWKSVGNIDSSLRLAGDYYLWIQFAKKAPLYTVKAYVSCFRKVKGQQSQDFEAYMRECSNICEPGDKSVAGIRDYLAFEHRIPVFLRKIFYRMRFGDQMLNLIELVDGKEPVLKKVPYYFY